MPRKSVKKFDQLVPFSVLSHAMSAVQYFLRDQRLELIDDVTGTQEGIYLGFDEAAWQEFLRQYYKVAQLVANHFVPTASRINSLHQPIKSPFFCQPIKSLFFRQPIESLFLNPFFCQPIKCLLFDNQSSSLNSE